MQSEIRIANAVLAQKFYAAGQEAFDIFCMEQLASDRTKYARYSTKFATHLCTPLRDRASGLYSKAVVLGYSSLHCTMVHRPAARKCPDHADPGTA
jgi:hypothetical protein